MSFADSDTVEKRSGIYIQAFASGLDLILHPYRETIIRLEEEVGYLAKNNSYLGSSYSNALVKMQIMILLCIYKPAYKNFQLWAQPDMDLSNAESA